MPLKISANGTTYTIGPENGTLETVDKITVQYAGDGIDRVKVSDHNQQTLGSFIASTIGFKTDVEYVIHIAPIEKGEPTTPVTRSISLERI